MSEKTTNEVLAAMRTPAFAGDGSHSTFTLLDWFAAQALPALCLASDTMQDAEAMAGHAYLIAVAMVNKRDDLAHDAA